MMELYSKEIIMELLCDNTNECVSKDEGGSGGLFLMFVHASY